MDEALTARLDDIRDALVSILNVLESIEEQVSEALDG